MQISDHELLQRIGVGSDGEVWLARNVLGGFRAVKIVYRTTAEWMAELRGFFQRKCRNV